MVAVRMDCSAVHTDYTVIVVCTGCSAAVHGDFFVSAARIGRLTVRTDYLPVPHSNCYRPAA